LLPSFDLFLFLLFLCPSLFDELGSFLHHPLLAAFFKSLFSYHLQMLLELLDTSLVLLIPVPEQFVQEALLVGLHDSQPCLGLDG